MDTQGVRGLVLDSVTKLTEENPMKLKGYEKYFNVLVLLVGISGSNALAETSSYKAKVVQTQTHSRNFGGCMAKLQPGPETLGGVSCKAGWVTFSCTGDFGTKSSGQNSLSQAQLAMIRDKPVFVVVDDGFKHNGYCYAPRVDTYR